MSEENTSSENFAAEELLQYIESIERLEEEATVIKDDIKNKKAEMKSKGFIVPAVNAILRLRKKDRTERLEEEAILETYKAALKLD